MHVQNREAIAVYSEQFSVTLTAWLGDVDSNHDKQSQSLLSYR